MAPVVGSALIAQFHWGDVRSTLPCVNPIVFVIKFWMGAVYVAGAVPILITGASVGYICDAIVCICSVNDWLAPFIRFDDPYDPVPVYC